MVRNWSNEPMKVLRYLDRQQRAKLLIPVYQVHSRIDDLERVHNEMVHQEDWRMATSCACEVMDRARANRLRLRQEAARQQDAAKRVFSGSTLRSPADDEVLTALTEDRAVRLLSRHVDVNMTRQRKTLEQQKKQQDIMATTAALAMDLDNVMNEIDEFELSLRRPLHMTRDCKGSTATDWTATRPSRVQCAARQRAATSPEAVSPNGTLTTGWLPRDSAGSSSAENLGAPKERFE
jgi:hypothetical protein